MIYPRGLIGLNKAKCGIPGRAAPTAKVNKSEIKIDGPKKRSVEGGIVVANVW